MSRLVISAGRRFGRFAVLFFVIPAAIIFCVWMSLLDSHPIWFIASGFVAMPIATTAAAFLFGTLFAGLRRRKVKGVPRTEAPGIWAHWEEIAGPRRAARTVIALEDDLNASVREERTLLGLLGRRVFLTVGIPLLAVTDEKALAAILAHEDAHLRNKDTNGGLNLAEFENSFGFVFEYAPPGATISGSLLHAAIGWLSESFEREDIRLSREAEIKADRHAAVSGNAEQAARALLLVAAADVHFKEKVYDALGLELRGAMRPPRPPLDRLLQTAGQLSEQTYLDACVHRAWERPDDGKSTHPSWAQRLVALGYAEAPDIQPIAVTALSTLLSPSATERYIAEFNKTWTEQMEDYLQR
ncbi:M48 family metallopeptidase [Mesorhizobium sophorae]|uniref:M48 family metallopeptidase n=1 Tax=Mesorhizobium sophorae TaxID=1300294 RepID=UPI000BA4BE0E|nr:M48 family metallopeptidase [Mesorhizobium sophorae]